MVSVLISATRSGWIDTVYGPMSAGLSERALGDLCVSENGVQTGPFGSQLHKRDYVNIGTPIITVEHLGENRIIHETMPRVSDEDKSRLSKYVLRDGDIVFSRVGSVDRRSLVRKEEDGWLFSGRCLRVRPDRNKIDPVFLSYFLGLPSFKEHIRSIAVGATMPSLNTKILNDVTVYFPTLPEQRRIAHILGTLDDKIELNRRMNETLEEMARAIFKDWFVDFGPVRAKMEGAGCVSAGGDLAVVSGSVGGVGAGGGAGGMGGEGFGRFRRSVWRHNTEYEGGGILGRRHPLLGYSKRFIKSRVVCVAGNRT